MNHTIISGACTLAAAALFAGCTDAGPSAPRSVVVDGRLPVFATGSSGPKVIVADGHGLDVALDPNPPSRRNRIEYHGGPVMFGTPDTFLIFYGNWPAVNGSPDANQTILTDITSNIGGHPYLAAWQAYTSVSGGGPSGGLLYAGAVNDAYSHGTTLSDPDVADIVRHQIETNGLPQDPSGIYIVVTSPDVDESSGYGTKYCAWHGRTTALGSVFRIGFVGWPERAPANCAPNGIGPNGTVGADAAASHLVAVLSDIATDPDFGGWYDKVGLEMADKCVWTYGTTYTALNGSRANIKLGGRDYLLQQLWLPSKSGGACVLHP